MVKVEGNSVPTVGNLRLNKLLQISQVLYAAKKEKYLFPEKFLAFEQGGIIYDIYHRFHFLVLPQRPISIKNLSRDLKILTRKIFNYFNTYTNQQLEDFVHEDPAWFTTWDDERSREMPQRLNQIVFVDLGL
nr:10662_t:CDS:2 [Entrophospora candida]